MRTQTRNKHARSLHDAYDQLIRRLIWERDRELKRAAQLAAKFGQSTADKVLARQVEHIIEQATR